MRAGGIAFEWFERDDYSAILDVMEDTHRLPPTFDEWEKNAEAGVQALEAAGHMVVPTLIKPDIFVQWCAASGSRPDARGRLKFCNTRHRQSPQVPGAKDDPERQALSPNVIAFAGGSRGHEADRAGDIDVSQNAATPPVAAETGLNARGGLGRFFPPSGFARSLWKRLFSDGGD